MAKKIKKKVKRSSVKCPKCAHKQMMRVPKKKCICEYTCKECGKKIKPKACCITCDYGKGSCGGCK